MIMKATALFSVISIVAGDDSLNLLQTGVMRSGMFHKAVQEASYEDIVNHPITTVITSTTGTPPLVKDSITTVITSTTGTPPLVKDPTTTVIASSTGTPPLVDDPEPDEVKEEEPDDPIVEHIGEDTEDTPPIVEQPSLFQNSRRRECVPTIKKPYYCELQDRWRLRMNQHWENDATTSDPIMARFNYNNGHISPPIKCEYTKCGWLDWGCTNYWTCELHVQYAWDGTNVEKKLYDRVNGKWNMDHPSAKWEGAIHARIEYVEIFTSGHDAALIDEAWMEWVFTKYDKYEKTRYGSPKKVDSGKIERMHPNYFNGYQEGHWGKDGGNGFCLSADSGDRFEYDSGKCYHKVRFVLGGPPKTWGVAVEADLDKTKAPTVEAWQS